MCGICLWKVEMLMEAIKDELNKRDKLYSEAERLKIVKMLVFPKLIHKFNSIPIKIARFFCVDIDILLLKIIWQGRGPK